MILDRPSALNIPLWSTNEDGDEWTGHDISSKFKTLCRKIHSSIGAKADHEINPENDRSDFSFKRPQLMHQKNNSRIVMICSGNYNFM